MKVYTNLIVIQAGVDEINSLMTVILLILIRSNEAFSYKLIPILSDFLELW